MDLREELDRSIGEGPPLPPPQLRLAAGRSALRRRRVVVGAAAAATALALVLPVSLTVGRLADRGAEIQPATPGVTDTSSPGAEQFVPRQGAPIDIDRTTRELVFEPGAVVEQRTDGVAGDIAGQSASVVIAFEGRTYWVVLAWDERRADVVYDEAGDNPGATFDEFVAENLPKLKRAYAVERGGSK